MNRDQNRPIQKNRRFHSPRNAFLSLIEKGTQQELPGHLQPQAPLNIPGIGPVPFPYFSLDNSLAQAFHLKGWLSAFTVSSRRTHVPFFSLAKNLTKNPSRHFHD